MSSEANRDAIAPAAFSVIDFCKAHGISRAFFYVMLRDGSGPRVMRARGRTLVSAEAAAEWRRRMETSADRREQSHKVAA